MPDYPLAFPAALHPLAVKVARRRVQAVATSPFTLQQQVFDWGAKRWEITITMQRMGSTEAAVFGQFLEDLNGLVGTFTFNLDPWVPGLAPAPGTKTFRLASPLNLWDSDFSVEWEFEIEAIEAL